MHILITGAAGMIGRKLVARLLKERQLAGRAITRLDLHDIVAPRNAGRTRHCSRGPHRRPRRGRRQRGAAGAASPTSSSIWPASSRARPNPISTSATASISTATRALFDAVRLAGHGPRVVYTSSIAVFGAPFPDIIYDDFQQTPLTSYGTQKLIGELILADYTRRGFFDGVGIRLPTICVRPGKPNKAASSFFSGIIREPLAGQRGLAAGAALGRAHPCQPALGGEFPDPCRRHRRRGDRAAAQPHHARRRRHRRRADRSAAPHCRRRCRQADPRRARRDGMEDRAELADPARGETRAGAWALSPSRVSTRSSGRISRTSWAGRSSERSRLSSTARRQPDCPTPSGSPTAAAARPPARTPRRESRSSCGCGRPCGHRRPARLPSSWRSRRLSPAPRR